VISIAIKREEMNTDFPEIILGVLTAAGAIADINPAKMVLSEKPAKKWEGAFVAGNGMIGVMQHGDPLNE